MNDNLLCFRPCRWHSILPLEQCILLLPYTELGSWKHVRSSTKLGVVETVYRGVSNLQFKIHWCQFCSSLELFIVFCSEPFYILVREVVTCSLSRSSLHRKQLHVWFPVFWHCNNWCDWIPARLLLPTGTTYWHVLVMEWEPENGGMWSNQPWRRPKCPPLGWNDAETSV